MGKIFDEIRKIRWTSFKDLIKTSGIVLVIIILSASVFLLYDFILGQIISSLY